MISVVFFLSFFFHIVGRTRTRKKLKLLFSRIEPSPKNRKKQKKCIFALKTNTIKNFNWLFGVRILNTIETIKVASKSFVVLPERNDW